MKSYGDINEMFEELEKEWEKEHPVKHVIDKLFRRTLFGYAPHYSLTHPFEILKDASNQIRWAWQRVFRGWDNRASWSIDFWLNDKLPEILLQLRENKHGTPIEFFDFFEHDADFGYSDEDEKLAQALWNEKLDFMIRGFQSARKLDNYQYKSDEERENLELEEKIGLELFIKYYRDLWD